MKRKKKPAIESDKQSDPIASLWGFLGLLNEISLSPEVLEFCTPGHKAGRGFAAMLAAEPVSLVLTLPEEVGYDV